MQPVREVEPGVLLIGDDEPDWYGGESNPYEAIKVMLAWHGPEATAWFCRLSAEKYLCRAGKKDDTVHQDLRKAAWYSRVAADLLEFGELQQGKTR